MKLKWLEITKLQEDCIGASIKQYQASGALCYSAHNYNNVGQRFFLLCLTFSKFKWLRINTYMRLNILITFNSL
jgi:hypothetical protein